MTTIALERGSAAATDWSPLRVSRALLAGISRRLTRWQDRRRLEALPDYLLADIGISRSDIERATEFGRHGIRNRP